MATRANDLPPPTKAKVWRTFLGWVVGLPLVVAAGLFVIWGGLWLSGGSLMARTELDVGTALFWMAAIALLYPVMLFVWVGELRAGLARARDWAGLTAEEQATLIAAARAPRRRRRKAKG
jgi:hypothetical protein